jgi:hypothetical protein
VSFRPTKPRSPWAPKVQSPPSHGALTPSRMALPATMEAGDGVLDIKPSLAKLAKEEERVGEPPIAVPQSTASPAKTEAKESVPVVIPSLIDIVAKSLGKQAQTLADPWYQGIMLPPELFRKIYPHIPRGALTIPFVTALQDNFPVSVPARLS